MVINLFKIRNKKPNPIFIGNLYIGGRMSLNIDDDIYFQNIDTLLYMKNNNIINLQKVTDVKETPKETEVDISTSDTKPKRGKKTKNKTKETN